MASKRTAVPPRVYTNEELEQLARELIARAPGLSGSDFKKLLAGELKKSDKLVLSAALRLVARGECYRWVQAKKMRFFPSDPYDALDNAVRQALAGEPLTEATLKARLEAGHRGFGDLLKGWLKGSISRGDVFLHPPAKGTRLKQLGLLPDVGGLLKKVLTELDKAMATAAGQKVQRGTVLEFLARALGISGSDGLSAHPRAARERFLVALFRLGLSGSPAGLLSVRELRGCLDFDKATFDKLALELSSDGLVTLHYHDFPVSLAAAEREELVEGPNGQYYVGIALRRES